MAIEMHTDSEGNETGGMTITGDDINTYRVLAMKHALSIEIKTGMKMSRGVSVLKVVNQTFGTTFRTKKQAYDWLVKLTEG
jgi:hypothetical protein